MGLDGDERPFAAGVADGAGTDRVEVQDHGALAAELALVALQEGARAGGDRLLAAGEEHVDVEVVEPAAAEALGEAEGEGRAGGVVVLAGLGGGEGDVEEKGDGDDQEDRRDELDDGEEETAEAREAEDAADEDGELGPEERLERADRAADEVPEGGPARLGLLSEGDAAAAGVVVGDEEKRTRLVAVVPGDDVLGGAAAEQAAEGGEEDAGVEEGEEGGDERERGAEGRRGDGEDAADDGERGEDGVGERPGRPGVDGLDLDLATEALEPVLQVRGGAPLGVAAGSAAADVDEGFDVSSEVHVGAQYRLVGTPSDE